MDKIVYIYKIVNLANNKIYIGQSNNPNRRFKQHMSNYKNATSKVMHKDVELFGKESFVLTIIEPCNNIDKAKDRERYWIEYFKEQGIKLYNQTKGGENPPTNYGDNNFFAKYTEEQALQVIDLLKNTWFSQAQIAKRLNVGLDFVEKINLGKSRNYLYKGIFPIRPQNYFDSIEDSIIYDLKNTSLLQKEIAKKYGVARSMITMINIGKNHHKDDIDYPIRPPKTQKKEVIKC